MPEIFSVEIHHSPGAEESSITGNTGLGMPLASYLCHHFYHSPSAGLIKQASVLHRGGMKISTLGALPFLY
jgi:hypothetical protein